MCFEFFVNNEITAFVLCGDTLKVVLDFLNIRNYQSMEVIISAETLQNFKSQISFYCKYMEKNDLYVLREKTQFEFYTFLKFLKGGKLK